MLNEGEKMKKLLTLLLSLLMMLALVGCGNGGGGTSDDGELPTITLAFSSLTVVPAEDAIKTVEDKLNAYLKDTLGKNYQVKLEIHAIGDYFTVVPMELAGGTDAPDVLQVFDVASFSSQGYIISLDQYMDKELAATKKKIGNVMGSGVVAGSTYMVPRFFGTVLDWKFIYNKQMVDDAGVDLSGVNSLESLEPVLAELKTVYPDEHFLVYADQFPTILAYEKNVSQIGTYAATVGEDTTLVNYYETDAFKEAINLAYKWRQAGYLDPEGSANTLGHDAVVMSGSSKGVIMGHSATEADIAKMFTSMNTYDEVYGGDKAEFGAKTLTIGDLYTDTLGIGVSYTCQHPELAADFIDLLYTDEFVWITIIYGAEGQDYVWNDDGTASYPDGLDGNTIPYNMLYSCGMIGNGFQSLPLRTSTDTGSNGQYGQELMTSAWCPPLYGFIPSTMEVMNEATAISNVVEQYSKALTYGDVDPATLYDQFISDLKDAGIDTLIANFQTQADAWYAANH